MATTATSVVDICAQAKAASRKLAALDTETKDRALEALASALEERSAEILEANERDMEAGRESGLSSSLLDRLQLTDDRLATIARDVRDTPRLPDPVGDVVEERTLPNGTCLRRCLSRWEWSQSCTQAMPERDRGLLGALHQVGERDRAPRLVDGGALDAALARHRRGGGRGGGPAARARSPR